MSLAAGSRIGPYEVKSLLGALRLGSGQAGGMGQVWRAHDTRLQRDVALKVLPAETLGDEMARASLVREARLASQLNHSHICTIYEVGETDGQTFVAMELVEGQALSARLSKGPLPIDQVLRYGQQMAAALSHAHGRGVVHRDLKSANIVITPDGQVKVLDFGLAKRLTTEELAEATTASRPSLTGPEMVAETLAYLAPEQLRGQPADARSDIWALGVVLYELATGKPPFRGETGFELTSAILNQPLPRLPSSIPAPLAGVIDRCLAKEPEERYQQSTEVRAALEAVASGQAGTAWRVVLRRRRRLLVGTAAGALALVVVAAVLFGLDVGGVRSRVTGGAGTAARAIRLVVLPFANASGDPAQDYLSDGLTQDVTTQLGRLHPAGLELIARLSVMRYKRRDTPIDQIGRELRVEYVLKGSAQREGSRIRIAAQLIKVADQAELWAEQYERDVAGILALQNEVARRVARALALKLLPAEQARLAYARAVIPEAYDAYQKGTQLRQTDRDAAERYFRLALEKDPAYAAAWAGIARVWNARGMGGRREATREAKAAVAKALELDDADFEAHRARAGILTYSDWNFPAAEEAWNELLRLDPNDPETLQGHCQFLMMMGRHDEGMAEIERAMELDPLSVRTLSWYAAALRGVGRYDDAIAAARQVLSLESDDGMAKNTWWQALVLKGSYDEALAMDKEAFARDPELMEALNRGYAEGGYAGAQKGVVRVWTARYGKPGGRPAITLAHRSLLAGDPDGALKWLEQAYADGDPNIPYIGGRMFHELRSDPRYQDLLRRVGLPQ
jgi:eukaryotic-like serine/threonine-protein kinase